MFHSDLIKDLVNLLVESIYIFFSIYFIENEFENMSTNDKNFDIIPMMVPFFDVHLLVPLLDFLREVEILLHFAYVCFSHVGFIL